MMPREKEAVNSTHEAIRNFVLDQFPLARQIELSDEASLIESGVVDSLGILELVRFVEGEFSLSVSDEELLPENFDSIASLAAFVDGKRA